jgi:predicted ATPase
MPEQLRGREAEVGMICDRLDQLLLGHGGLVVIRGPAGIGKSALLAAAERAARGHDIRVFHGSSSPAGQTVPLAPLLEALVGSDDPPVSPQVCANSAALPISASGCSRS